MCQARKDGGQRCTSHASAAYDKALRAASMSDSDADYARLETASVEYASTPGGKTHFEAQAAHYADRIARMPRTPRNRNQLMSDIEEEAQTRVVLLRGGAMRAANTELRNMLKFA